MVSWEFIFTVNLDGSAFNWRWFASSPDIQEWLKSLSQRTSALVLTFGGLTRSTSRTRRSRFTSLIEVSADELVVPKGFAFSTADWCFCGVHFVERGNVIFFSLFMRKTRSAPWCSVLWVLRQPSCVHFRCLPFKHAKQSLLSAALLARCVRVSSLVDGHQQMDYWHLLSTHANWSFFALWDVLLEICCFAFALAAETLEETFVFVALMLPLSSVLLFKEIVFLRSWVSAFS